MGGRKSGYDQILWLLGSDFQVTEAGASNFFVVWKTKEGKEQLVTAPLDSKIILDGITRRSVVELARERLVEGSKHLVSDMQPLEVVERTYTMIELEEAWKEGRLIEAFVSGTAVSSSLSVSCTEHERREVWFLIKILCTVLHYAMLGYQFQGERVGHPDG